MRASGEIEIETRRQKSRGIESIGGTIEKKRFTKIFRILLKIVFLKKRLITVNRVLQKKFRDKYFP